MLQFQIISHAHVESSFVVKISDIFVLFLMKLNYSVFIFIVFVDYGGSDLDVCSEPYL